MGRGLGERQREVLDRLAAAPPGEMVPLHRLVDDPGDSVTLARARSAVHGLERRGLVITTRTTDPDRLVDTTAVVGEVDASFQMRYAAVPAQRAWFGLHVQLAGYVDPDDEPRQGRRRLRPMFQPAGPTA